MEVEQEMKNFRKLLSLVCMLVLAMSLCTTAFAALTADEEAYVNNHISDPGVLAFLDTNTTQWPAGTFGGTVYYYKDANGETNLKSYISRQQQQQQQNTANTQAALDNTSQITSGLGVTPDFGGATSSLEGFVPIINIFLGVICTLIVTFMTVFTAFDVCYIVFPVFRNTCEEAKASGTGIMAGKSANGGTKLRFVSDEAQYVVKNCSVDNGKNPLTAYLGKRVFAYIMVAIILFILLTGNIQLITNIALKVVSGIMNVLGSLS